MHVFLVTYVIEQTAICGPPSQLVDIAKHVAQQHKNLTQTHFTNVDNTLVMISSSTMHQQMEN